MKTNAAADQRLGRPKAETSAGSIGAAILDLMQVNAAIEVDWRKAAFFGATSLVLFGDI